jgi:hypothetical protein
VTVRRSVAAATLLLAAPVLSSCGFEVQTNQPYTPAVGVNEKAAEVDVLNALIVVDSVSAAFSESTTLEGTVVATLVNGNEQESDALAEVTSDAGEVTFEVGGDTEVPAGGLLNLADEGGVTASGSGETMEPGLFVPVTFSFERSESVSIQVPVVEAGMDGPYSDVPLPGDVL